MELPTVSALEFNQLRASIKNYIKTKSEFTDYDFDGSNLSMLVDILAYNTLYTTYNVNMASNELNLDTAVLRDNIVSQAKKLGYTAGSFTSAKATVDITVDGLSSLNIDKISLKSGAVLSTKFEKKNYTFISREPINLSVPAGSDEVVFRDVDLFEGTSFNISYTVDTSNEHQRFIIPNNFIDSESIKVSVKDDATSSSSIRYTKKNTIVNVSQSDTVFFVEEIQDQQYEVIFGDDVIGRKLQNGEIVNIEYISTAGGALNNVKESAFTFVGGIDYISSGVIQKIPLSNINFQLNTEFTDGGSEFESIASIKYRAPRYYASQGRAVTTSDYESLIMQLYGNADLVKVVGGETLNPPEYGKVFITIKPKVGEVVSNSEKSRILTDLKSFVVGSITPEIRDPKRYTINLNPFVVYDQNKTRKTPTEFNKLITDLIVDFENSDAFKNFGGVYSQSNILSEIQNLDDSITFSNIKVKTCVVTRLEKNNNIETKYNGSFFTSVESKLDSHCAVTSTFFCSPGIANPVRLCIKSFGAGNCVIDENIYLVDDKGNFLRSVGSIDFETGEFSFSVASCDDATINICAVPTTPNLDVDGETYPDIEIGDIVIIDNPLDVTPTDLEPFTELPVPSSDGVTGDPNLPSDDGSTIDGEIDDPNNIDTIDNLTPEQDPNRCS
jgi:hypothetical protein